MCYLHDVSEIIIIFAPESYNMSNRREKNKPRNTISKQLELPEPREKERNDNLIQLGKFFYSLAGMTYAGGILAKLIDFRYGDTTTLYWSTFATVLLAVFAWYFVKFGNVKR